MFTSILTKIGEYLGKEALERVYSAFKSWLRYVTLKKKVEDTATNEDRDEATDNLNDIMR